jgi:hypothetical protein
MEFDRAAKSENVQIQAKAPCGVTFSTTLVARLTRGEKLILSCFALDAGHVDAGQRQFAGFMNIRALPGPSSERL